MGNIFDSLRDSAFDVTTNVMGYDASWIPSATPEADPITARVHFKDSNMKEALGGVEYMPLNPFIEYRHPFLPGLYESVRDSNGGEVIVIDGISYDVQTVDRLADGKTYKATLNPVETPP